MKPRDPRALPLALSVALALALGAGALGAGCTGSLGGMAEGEADGDCPGCDPETQGATTILTTRFPRLSHRQWENTVRDLFYLPGLPGVSSSFIGDSVAGNFDNNEQSLLVTPAHWADYQTGAEEIAALVTSDAAILAGIVPADLPTEPAARARAWIERFGLRAYRRPLTPGEVDGYVALFDDGAEAFASGDAFRDGVRLTLGAFLQSPHFLYRVQQSSEVVDHLIPLGGYEIATKLSYLVWNTMPDDELFAAAEAGELDEPDGILTQAERMLDDDRAAGMILSFHEQLFGFEDYLELNKDPELFPQFTPATGDDMRQEAELFVNEVVLAEDGGLTELLTSNVTYVNAGLAAIYGIESAPDGGDFGEEFERVELDPATRRGLLTRLGFLASHGTATQPHSILRGVFVNHKVLCSELPPPPDMIPPPPTGSWDTNREMVEAYTGDGTCGEGCHSTFINPAGFAFENFDAIGQHRTTDSGFPIDASGTYPFEEEGPQSFVGSSEFVDLVADSYQTHACYARHWLEFGYGREVQAGDEPTIEALAADSPTMSVKSLVLALTQTKAFRTRAPLEETQP